MCRSILVSRKVVELTNAQVQVQQNIVFNQHQKKTSTMAGLRNPGQPSGSGAAGRTPRAGPAAACGRSPPVPPAPLPRPPEGWCTAARPSGQPPRPCQVAHRRGGKIWTVAPKIIIFNIGFFQLFMRIKISLLIIHHLLIFVTFILITFIIIIHLSSYEMGSHRHWSPEGRGGPTHNSQLGGTS